VIELLGTRLCVLSSFHPHTDGQTEWVNQTLEAYLRHFVSATSMNGISCCHVQSLPITTLSINLFRPRRFI
jgi:hypothetical protein